MRHKGKRVLRSSDIDLEHDASHYGFSWNKKEMYKLLENYQGSYYIGASVISRFDKEFKDICQQYGSIRPLRRFPGRSGRVRC